MVSKVFEEILNKKIVKKMDDDFSKGWNQTLILNKKLLVGKSDDFLKGVIAAGNFVNREYSTYLEKCGGY